MNKENDQVIDIMLPDGEWVTVAGWVADDSEYDAAGWLAEFGQRYIGSREPVEFPDGSFAILENAIAIRARSA